MSELTDRLRHPAWLRTNPPTLASLVNIDTMTEAADRIEELETAFWKLQEWVENRQARIDELETALREIDQKIKTRRRIDVENGGHGWYDTEVGDIINRAFGGSR